MTSLSRRAVVEATLVPAVVDWTPVAYAKTPLPSTRSRLVAERFSGGWTPALQRQVDGAGGIDRWFSAQLAFAGLSDTFYTASQSWWPSNASTPGQLVERNRSGTESFWEAGANYQRWSLVRRIHAQRHVQEQLASFWEHHFHVPAYGESPGPFRPAYGRMLRARALGAFKDLLKAAITHPAMGCYLGNAESRRDAPNENLGRELLELHTVGRGAGYTETDVKNSARILTGYRVDTWGTWQVGYDPASHWVGPVKVLGFSDPNGSSDGRAVTLRYLDYLARHPATADRIARKLARRFVSDTPSAALVSHLAQVYLANDTRIVPVLRALVASSEFAGSTGSKVRTPEEDVVATYRALDIRVQAPQGAESAANALLWQVDDIGLMPYAWPRPDGRPDTGDAWSSVARLLASFDVHYTLAGGWWPELQLTYRAPASWLPQTAIRMDYLVDHLSRSVLGRPSTATLLKACCQATNTLRSATITRDHDLIRYDLARLLVTLLDSPAHLGR